MVVVVVAVVVAVVVVVPVVVVVSFVVVNRYAWVLIVCLYAYTSNGKNDKPGLHVENTAAWTRTARYTA